MSSTPPYLCKFPFQLPSRPIVQHPQYVVIFFPERFIHPRTYDLVEEFGFLQELGLLILVEGDLLMANSISREFRVLNSDSDSRAGGSVDEDGTDIRH